MKKVVYSILGGAVLLALPLFLTSCDDILGEWDKPAPAVVTPAETPAATVTTAPTATTGAIFAGSTTALVTAGVADGGTMMYKVTDTNSQPTSTDGFSATVPTAQTLAVGTFYVWYYAKASDAIHTDSEISATSVAVTLSAKPAATVTTDPAAATGTIAAGSSTALVTAGTADGGTMMYKVTTTNTKPTSTTGFSSTVPTAETLTSSGTYYVWYYVKADDNHNDSGISATAISVNVPFLMAALATNTDKGRLICRDGHIHTYGEDAACTKTRVAKIIYVGSNTENTTYNHGLALALFDEGQMTWYDAMTACSTTKNTSTPVTGALWMLPSYYNQWQTMASAAGGSTAMRDGFTSVGGNNLNSSHYWSTSVDNDDTTRAWGYLPDYNNGSFDLKTASYWWARACLAF